MSDSFAGLSTHAIALKWLRDFQLGRLSFGKGARDPEPAIFGVVEKIIQGHSYRCLEPASKNNVQAEVYRPYLNAFMRATSILEAGTHTWDSNGTYTFERWSER